MIEYEYGVRTLDGNGNIKITTWHDDEEEARAIVAIVDSFATVLPSKGSTFVVRRTAAGEVERVEG